MKILKDKYPMGSFKGQKSPGRYIDEYLYRNLELLSKKITDDMTFLGVFFSSTLEVGTGKSVLATQIGEAWSELMKKHHDVDVPFTVDNIVWNPNDLIKRSFELPQYSCILLDEWELATYWSDVSLALRKYFQKCRQLNQFILIIIPNFFRLPIDYAISRSVFAIDVVFEDNFTRGFFKFYDFRAKKLLYIKGKKFLNYNAAYPTFVGRFTDGYGVDEVQYRRKKLLDMLRFEKEDPKLVRIYEEKTKIFQRISKYFNLTQEKWAEIFDVNQKTISNWLRKDYSKPQDPYINELLERVEKNVKEFTVDEEELERKVLESKKISENLPENKDEISKNGLEEIF